MSMLTSGNKIEGGQQFLKFTYERVDCLEKYMNILKMSSVRFKFFLYLFIRYKLFILLFFIILSVHSVPYHSSYPGKD